MSELRAALRQWFHRPAFTAAALLVLACGLGSTIAIFSLIRAVLLRPLAFRDPDRLVWIWARRTDRDKAFFSIPDYLDLLSGNRTLEGFSAYAGWGVNLDGSRGTGCGGLNSEPERLQGIRVSAHAMQMLGVQAAAGRTLLPEDDDPAHPRVVMLDYGLWQRRFGGSTSCVGASVALNGDLYTVVGILPKDFIMPNAETSVVAPLRPASHPRRAERGTNMLRGFARLRPGVSIEQAAADLRVLVEEASRRYPDTNGKKTAPRVLPLQEELTGDYRAPLFMLLGAIGGVLLITCVNLAGLLFARATTRRKEMAIRLAIGATPARLVRQLMAESLLLAAAGGLLGCCLAAWMMPLLVAASPAQLPRSTEIRLDATVLVFSVGVTLLCGLLFGIAPAWRAARSGLRGAMQEQRAGHRGHRALVVVEVGLSVVLLMTASLFLKSFLRLLEVSPGFPPQHLLLVRLSLPLDRYPSGTVMEQFRENVTARAAALPGVRGVAVASVVPLSGWNVRTDFIIADHPPATPADMPAAQNRWVSPGYFQVMGIPIRRGREFNAFDTATSTRVFVVDEALAKRYFPGADPVGQRIIFDDGTLHPYEGQIVGICGNVLHNGLEDEQIPTLYAPIAQTPPGSLSFLAAGLNLVVRTSGEPLAMATDIRREIRALDALVPTSSVRSMDQFVDDSVASRRFHAWLLAVFAGMALLLAASGLYALLAYSVSRRIPEIGIRIALGAQPGHLVRAIMGEGLRLAGLGLVLGVAGSLAASRLLSALLFKVAPNDPATLAVSAALLGLTALAASYVPARRATRVSPLTALRYE